MGDPNPWHTYHSPFVMLTKWISLGASESRMETQAAAIPIDPRDKRAPGKQTHLGVPLRGADVSQASAIRVDFQLLQPTQSLYRQHELGDIS